MPPQSGLFPRLLSQLTWTLQTDASRAQSLELQIQARVAGELQRLQEKEAETLKSVFEKISEAANEEKKSDDGNSRHKVSKEVEALRSRLEARQKARREIPPSVEQARADVVRCLRENDRRPLDCWREVEAFREEVRKLERSWVDKVVS